MDKATKATIQELKVNREGVHRFEEDGNKYGLLIISRGEQLFFQVNDAGLICDVSARYSLIAPASIKSWDNGHKITEEEKGPLLEKIIYFYKKAYKDDLKVFSENGK